MWFFLESCNVPFFAAIALSILSAGLIGLIMERLTIRPLRTNDLLVMTMVTIAVSIVMRGLLMFKFGKEPYSYAAFTEGDPLVIGGAVIQLQTLWVLGITAACILGLYAFFNLTMVGKAMRACSFDPTAASLVGIPVSRMIMFSFNPERYCRCRRRCGNHADIAYGVWTKAPCLPSKGSVQPSWAGSAGGAVRLSEVSPSAFWSR